jgi:anaerobic selenocysteine-containing dehydrogenase
MTPLKRVDFDPDGECNIEQCGISGYEPISWEQATDIVVKEINRVKHEAGPAAILSNPSSHHMWGNVGYLRLRNRCGSRAAQAHGVAWCQRENIALPRESRLVYDAYVH